MGGDFTGIAGDLHADLLADVWRWPQPVYGISSGRLPLRSGRGVPGGGADRYAVVAGYRAVLSTGAGASFSGGSSVAVADGETTYFRPGVADSGGMDCQPKEMVVVQRHRSRIFIREFHCCRFRSGNFPGLPRDAATASDTE